MVSQAADLLAGKVPYRDFDLFVTPAVWYLNAAVFWIAGPSVVATRIAAALCLVATMAVTKRIVMETTGAFPSTPSSDDARPSRDTTSEPFPTVASITPSAERWGYAGASLIGVFAVWAFPAWTISFYSPYAVLTALVSLACLLAGMRTGRTGWALACGLSLGLTIAFKQNYGVLATLGCAFALAVDRIRSRWTGGSTCPPPGDANAPGRASTWNFSTAAIRAAAGIALVVVPGVILLALQGALPDAVQSLALRPVRGFIDAHSIPYLRIDDLWKRHQIWTIGGLLYMAVPMTRDAVVNGWPRIAIVAVTGMHFALYWMPWCAFAGAGLFALRRAAQPPPADRALVATSIFTTLLFLGVFPRADFNHLINVYQPVLATFVALAARAFGAGRWRANSASRFGAIGCGILVSCYVAVAAVWLDDLVRSMSFLLESPRGGVLVDEADARRLNHEVGLLRSETREGEAVFALPGLSMIPFLADRPMPTRYYNYQSVHIAHDGGRSAAAEIAASGARVLLIHTYNFFADPTGILTYAPALADYVIRHFEPKVLIAGRTNQLLVRRDAVVAPARREWLWSQCEIPSASKSGQLVREELLVQTLYHSFDSPTEADGTRDGREIVTRCRFEVPPNSRLRITADLRQPVSARSSGRASAEMWMHAEGEDPRRILREDWTLDEMAGLSTAARAEHEIDLTAGAGKTVTLELRSRLDGTVPPTAGDFHGLSVVWSGGRIETPAFAASSRASSFERPHQDGGLDRAFESVPEREFAR